MKIKIHFVVRSEPIPYHGLDQLAACGLTVQRAHPVVIVPDGVVVSVGILSDQFGSKMCKECKLIEPNEGYIYFMAEEEFVQSMRRVPDFAETA